MYKNENSSKESNNDISDDDIKNDNNDKTQNKDDVVDADYEEVKTQKDNNNKN